MINACSATSAAERAAEAEKENIRLAEQAELARARTERLTYSRVRALTGNILCMYAVDPATGRYTEYSATEKVSALGLAKSGEDFFTAARGACRRHVSLEDVDLFLTMSNRADSRMYADKRMLKGK